MKPIEFKGSNALVAKNQKQYQPLPAFMDTNDASGIVVSCWKMNFREWLLVIFTGRVYVQSMTFRKPLQPLLLTVKSPLVFINETADNNG